MNDFPGDVRQFIADHIHSLAQLEVLLLLHGAPEREWQPSEVGTALYTPPEMAGAQLQDLCTRGLIGCVNDRYRYLNTHKFDEVIGKVAELYKERRVTMITLIYSKPVDKVRTFADAFRFRKDP